MRAFFDGAMPRPRRTRDPQISASSLKQHVNDLVELEVCRLGRPPCTINARILEVQVRPAPGVITFEIPDPTQALLTLGEGTHSISLRDVSGFTIPS